MEDAIVNKRWPRLLEEGAIARMIPSLEREECQCFWINISKPIKTGNCKNSISRVTFSAHQETINDPLPPFLAVSQPDQQV